MCETLMVELGQCSEAANNVDFDHGGSAYRVNVLCPPGFVSSTGKSYPWADWRQIPTPFVREKDAELAMMALIKEGLTTPELIRDAGMVKLRHIMLSALQW